MLKTVENFVERMNNLLRQLKDDAAPGPSAAITPRFVGRAGADELADARVAVETRGETGPCAVTIDPERLRSALTHLVQNAVDVSCPGDRVMISSCRFGTRLSIEVAENGPGMGEAFVRDELFLPFRSTKSGGYGI